MTAVLGVEDALERIDALTPAKRRIALALIAPEMSDDAAELEINPDDARRWREDPVAFVREMFHVEPDAWQAKALRAFASTDRRAIRIAMKAAKGPGKTAVLAWMIWNFLACYIHMGDDPKGAATSISQDNLDMNLWPELAKWQARSTFLSRRFVWTKTRISSTVRPATWFFAARAWSHSANAAEQANTLSGIHGRSVLFVGDEAGGYPDALIATAEAVLATDDGWAKLILAGNPTSLEGPLYRACTIDAGFWTVIEITGDPDDPNRSPRIRLDWAREQIAKYGRDNPWVLVNVFGQFPPNSLNTLLGPDDVEAAKRRYGALETHIYTWAQKRIGVDVARFGDDRTVIFRRQGLAAFLPEVLRQQDTVAIAARVAYRINEWSREDTNPEVLSFIDDSGHWGHGVLDNLKAGGYDARAVLFEDRSTADPRYENKRAEMWMNMAEWIKGRGSLPPDLPIEMTSELTVPQYTFVGGKIRIEPKDQIKLRLGRSPDLADALALTFALPDMPAAMHRQQVTQGAGRVVSDYDPLSDDREREPRRGRVAVEVERDYA